MTEHSKFPTVCGYCGESVDHWTPNPMNGLVKCMACGWATEPECKWCGWAASDDHDHPDDCGPTFGCVECDGTGLHLSPDEVGAPLIVDVQRHDECGAFPGDVSAAQFVALVHPDYYWIGYRTADGGAHVACAHTITDVDALPDVAAEAPVMLSTKGAGFAELWRALWGAVDDEGPQS